MTGQTARHSQYIKLDCQILDRREAPDGVHVLTVAVLNLPPDTRVEVTPPARIDTSQDVLQDAVSRKLDEFAWPPRLQEAFQFERMLYFGDLCTVPLAKLRRHPGVGDKTIENVTDTLASLDLKTDMRLSWWDALREKLAGDDAVESVETIDVLGTRNPPTSGLLPLQDL